MSGVLRVGQATALVAVVLLSSPTTRSIEGIHATANLTNGDHIRIGDHEFTFEIEPL